MNESVNISCDLSNEPIRYTLMSYYIKISFVSVAIHYALLIRGADFIWYFCETLAIQRDIRVEYPKNQTSK